MRARRGGITFGRPAVTVEEWKAAMADGTLHELLAARSGPAHGPEEHACKPPDGSIWWEKGPTPVLDVLAEEVEVEYERYAREVEEWSTRDGGEDMPWTCPECRAVWDLDWGSCHECLRRDEDGPEWHRRPRPCGACKGTHEYQGVPCPDCGGPLSGWFLSAAVPTSEPGSRLTTSGGWCAPTEGL